jgi:hypothetical protein
MDNDANVLYSTAFLAQLCLSLITSLFGYAQPINSPTI